MARVYCQVTGVVLLLLGVAGLLRIGIPGFLSVNEPAEIVVHFLTGAIAAYAGFSGGGYGRAAVSYAKVFGVVYLLLAVAGFVRADLPAGIHFDLGCNLAHLILGVWGIWAGYMRGAAMMEPAA